MHFLRMNLTSKINTLIEIGKKFNYITKLLIYYYIHVVRGNGICKFFTHFTDSNRQGIQLLPR